LCYLTLIHDSLVSISPNSALKLLHSEGSDAAKEYLDSYTSRNAKEVGINRGVAIDGLLTTHAYGGMYNYSWYQHGGHCSIA
jgi:hypothetical protein